MLDIDSFDTVEELEEALKLEAQPECIDSDVRIKVVMRYYATREDAELAAAFAIAEGVHQARRGYDFGYHTPGDITEVADGRFSVVFP